MRAGAEYPLQVLKLNCNKGRNYALYVNSFGELARFGRRLSLVFKVLLSLHYVFFRCGNASASTPMTKG